MFPNLLGFEDSSYVLFIILGVILAAVVAILYLKKKQITKAGVLDLLICLSFAIALGVIFAILFENLYEAIALKENYVWVWKLTFYGGLLGGVIGFLVTYALFRNKTSLDLKQVVVIAPACITGAHAIGRIGCFFAGCCYGKHTDSWIGINFPGIGKVIPTQLIECFFLFVLFGVLCFFAFKKDFKYTFIIYLVAYSIFRFIIEFYRGDERGVAGALAPSQIWSIVLLVISVPLYFYLSYVFVKKYEQK